MGCGVVKELLDFGHCVFGGVSLLSGDGSKDRKHGGTDGASIVKKGTCDFLGIVFVGRAEERTFIDFFTVLCFCLVFRFDVGVRLVL